MNEINLKDFEFESYLLENVKLFDEVLEKLGEPPLFENENFSPFLDFPIVKRYLALELIPPKPNVMPVTIWFEGDSLRIDIDHIPETFEWAKEHIDEDRTAVIELIENLFTGFVLIEYRGSSARFIQMFDAQGFFVRSFSRNVLLHMFGCYLLRQDDYRKLYLPLFKYSDKIK